MRRQPLICIAMFSALTMSACATQESPQVTDLKQELVSAQQENMTLEEQVAMLKGRKPQVEYVTAKEPMSNEPMLLPPSASAGEMLRARLRAGDLSDRHRAGAEERGVRAYRGESRALRVGRGAGAPP